MKDEYAYKVYKDLMSYRNRPKDFYKDMIKAIIKDFRENNDCSYLNRFFVKDNRTTWIERSVLFELKSFYIDETFHYYTDLPMFPINRDERAFGYLPYSSAYEGITVRTAEINMARELNRELTHRFTHRPKINDYVFHTYLPQSSEKRPPENLPKDDAVNSEYGKTIQAAKEESARIIREAQEQAQKIKSEAESKAKLLEEEAESKAKLLEEEAESKAKRLEEEAELKLQKVTESSQNQAQAIVRRTLDDYQQQIQDAWYKQTIAYGREDESYPSLLEAKREYIEDTIVLKRELRDKMKEFIDEMRTLQDEMEIKINKRQIGIYHHEFTKLADCFGQLYIIVRKNPFMTDYLMGESDNLSQNTLEDLKKLKSTLNVILKRLEAAMASFGMYVYYPEPGDRYDDILHDRIMTDDESDPYEMAVSECLTPGVMRKGDTAEEDEPVIRAVVNLKRKGDD